MKHQNGFAFDILFKLICQHQGNPIYQNTYDPCEHGCGRVEGDLRMPNVLILLVSGVNSMMR